MISLNIVIVPIRVYFFDFGWERIKSYQILVLCLQLQLHYCKAKFEDQLKLDLVYLHICAKWEVKFLVKLLKCYGDTVQLLIMKALYWIQNNPLVMEWFWMYLGFKKFP